jgi:hypothetical protein
MTNCRAGRNALGAILLFIDWVSGAYHDTGVCSERRRSASERDQVHEAGLCSEVSGLFEPQRRGPI